MRFLLDENMSPMLVGMLNDAAIETTHVRDLGMQGSSDEQLLDYASEHGLVIVSADTDFGALLAQSNDSGPSVVLVRRQRGRRAAALASLIEANLDEMRGPLESGSIVVLDDYRIRIRALPLVPHED